MQAFLPKQNIQHAPKLKGTTDSKVGIGAFKISSCLDCLAGKVH